MSANFGNLDWVDGQVSVPGIYPEMYYIPKSYISAWPQFAATPATSAAEVTLVGDFTLESLKTWKKINCIDVKSDPTSEQQGEIRCKTYNNKLKVVVSLTNEDASALAKRAANSDLVFIFQERDSGKYRVVGSEKFTTLTKCTLNIGGSPTGEKGTTLEIESPDICPFPFYDGNIVTDDGDVNPSA
jgi:hypothetical protein